MRPGSLLLVVALVACKSESKAPPPSVEDGNTVTAAPTTPAVDVLRQARALLDKGLPQVKIVVDGRQVCRAYRTDGAGAKEKVQVSVLLRDDGAIWFGLTDVDLRMLPELDESFPAALDGFQRHRRFRERRDAELAAEPGATADQLAGVLEALCARFEELRFLAPHELAIPRPT